MCLRHKLVLGLVQIISLGSLSQATFGQQLLQPKEGDVVHCLHELIIQSEQYLYHINQERQQFYHDAAIITAFDVTDLKQLEHEALDLRSEWVMIWATLGLVETSAQELAQQIAQWLSSDLPTQLQQWQHVQNRNVRLVNPLSTSRQFSKRQLPHICLELLRQTVQPQ